jgi:hypothetical protein
MTTISSRSPFRPAGTPQSSPSLPSNQPAQEARGGRLAALATLAASLPAPVDPRQADAFSTPGQLAALAPTSILASTHGVTDMALAEQTPVGEAKSAIAQEQTRLQQEKYTFSPEEEQKVADFNAKNHDKLTKHNSKVNKEIAGVDAEISKELQASGGKPSKKLEDLSKKRGELEGKLKSPVDLKQVTAEIDEVMGNPSLSNDQRKDKLEEIRKRYDLKKNGGPVSMHDTFTGRMSKLTDQSKKRVDQQHQAHKKELDAELDQARKTFGKNSPEVKALEAQKKDVDSLYKQEKDQLGDQSKFLKDAYRKRSFWEKLGGFFKGIGKAVVGVAKGVFNTLTAIPKGIIKGAGALFRGDIGGAFKAVGGGVVNAVKSGVKTANEALPLAAAAASFVPGLNAVAVPLNAAVAAKGVVQGIKNGDVLGAVASAAGGVAGGAAAAGYKGVANAAQAVSSTAEGARAAASGDVLGAALSGQEVLRAARMRQPV